MPEINKHELEHLAKLARLEFDEKEAGKLPRDLAKILDHFKELQTLDTENIPPVTGGTDLKNVFREDTASENTNRGKGVDAFPDTRDGFLKIPAVFE